MQRYSSQKRRPCEGEDRGWCSVSASQGCWQHQKLEEAGVFLPLALSEELIPDNTLISEFSPLEPGDNTFLLWQFDTTTLGNESGHYCFGLP